MTKLQTAILEAIRTYVGMTENDRSTYRPETMRHLATLMEASISKPDEWEPLKEWVTHNFSGPSIEYMESFYPKVKKNEKPTKTQVDAEE